MLPGNTLSITTHDITPATAQYVRMTVTKATQTSDTTTRIYEFQVFNTVNSGNIAPPDFSLSLTQAHRQSPQVRKQLIQRRRPL